MTGADPRKTLNTSHPGSLPLQLVAIALFIVLVLAVVPWVLRLASFYTRYLEWVLR